MTTEKASVLFDEMMAAEANDGRSDATDPLSAILAIGSILTVILTRVLIQYASEKILRYMDDAIFSIRYYTLAVIIYYTLRDKYWFWSCEGCAKVTVPLQRLMAIQALLSMLHKSVVAAKRIRSKPARYSHAGEKSSKSLKRHVIRNILSTIFNTVVSSILTFITLDLFPAHCVEDCTGENLRFWGFVIKKSKFDNGTLYVARLTVGYLILRGLYDVFMFFKKRKQEKTDSNKYDV